MALPQIRCSPTTILLAALLASSASADYMMRGDPDASAGSAGSDAAGETTGMDPVPMMNLTWPFPDTDHNETWPFPGNLSLPGLNITWPGWPGDDNTSWPVPIEVNVSWPDWPEAGNSTYPIPIDMNISWPPGTNFTWPGWPRDGNLTFPLPIPVDFNLSWPSGNNFTWPAWPQDKNSSWLYGPGDQNATWPHWPRGRNSSSEWGPGSNSSSFPGDGDHGQPGSGGGWGASWGNNFTANWCQKLVRTWRHRGHRMQGLGAPTLFSPVNASDCESFVGGLCEVLPWISPDCSKLADGWKAHHQSIWNIFMNVTTDGAHCSPWVPHGMMNGSLCLSPTATNVSHWCSESPQRCDYCGIGNTGLSMTNSTSWLNSTQCYQNIIMTCLTAPQSLSTCNQVLKELNVSPAELNSAGSNGNSTSSGTDATGTGADSPTGTTGGTAGGTSGFKGAGAASALDGRWMTALAFSLALLLIA